MEIVAGKGKKPSRETDFGEALRENLEAVTPSFAVGQRNHVCGPARFAVTLRNQRVGPSLAGRDR